MVPDLIQSGMGLTCPLYQLAPANQADSRSVRTVIPHCHQIRPSAGILSVSQNESFLESRIASRGCLLIPHIINVEGSNKNRLRRTVVNLPRTILAATFSCCKRCDLTAFSTTTRANGLITTLSRNSWGREANPRTIARVTFPKPQPASIA